MSSFREDVCVILQNEAGEEVEFVITQKTTVYSLKCQIAEEWPLPPFCQKIRMEDRLAADDKQKVYDFLEPSAEFISGTIEEVFDELPACLEHGATAVRIMAVRALSKLAQVDYDRAFEALEVKLADPESEVRRCAIDTLVRIARKEDESAPLFLCAALTDYESDVRNCALDALHQFVDPGRADVSEELLEHLASWRSEVRRCAAKALGLLGKTEDHKVIKGLAACLADADVEVRSLALHSLLEMAPRGNTVGLLSSLPHLQNDEAEIRAIAMRAVSQLCMEGGNLEVSKLLLPQLKHTQPVVRAAAADALVFVNPREDPEDTADCVREFLEMLGDPMPPKPKEEEEGDDDGSDASGSSAPPAEPVKPEETHAAEGVEGADGAEGVPPPPPPPVEDDWRVRRSVVAALGGLSRVGDGYVIVCVAKRLEDDFAEVRAAAVGTLCILSPEFGSEGIANSVMVTSHSHMLVPFNDGKKWTCDDKCETCSRKEEGIAFRWSCRLCFYDVCRGCMWNYRSDRLGFGEVLARMDSRRADVEFAAVQTLVGLCPPCHIPLLGRLVRRARHCGPDMRRYLLAALPPLFGEEHAREALAKHAASQPEPWRGVRLPPDPEAEREKAIAAAKAKAKAKLKAFAPSKFTVKEAGPEEEEEEEEEEEVEQEPEVDPDADISEEVLGELEPTEAIELLLSALRRLVLKGLEDQFAEERLLALMLLPQYVSDPQDEEANAALNRRIKDRDERVRKMASDLLEKRDAEWPLLQQTPYPLGIYLGIHDDLYPDENGRSRPDPRKFPVVVSKMDSRRVNNRSSLSRGSFVLPDALSSSFGKKRVSILSDTGSMGFGTSAFETTRQTQ